VNLKKNFFAELKRRNVYKVAIAYAVVAWLLIQAASILLPTFEVPTSVMKAFVVLLALGFVVSVMISWAFEATPEGLKRTENPLESTAETQPPSPSGFAEIVSDGFPVLHARRIHGCFSSQSFWKAGSLRNGSQIGSSLNNAGVTTSREQPGTSSLS
jgi:hypothetical protein